MTMQCWNDYVNIRDYVQEALKLYQKTLASRYSFLYKGKKV
jgi:hypothetical protein